MDANGVVVLGPGRSVEVLNGFVSPGDRVAYAVRTGNRAGIRLGIVRDITAYDCRVYNQAENRYEPGVGYNLKIEVTHTSGDTRIGRIVSVGTANVAKLDAPAPAPIRHQELSCTQASTERAWSPTVQQRTRVFGFG